MQSGGILAESVSGYDGSLNKQSNVPHFDALQEDANSWSSSAGPRCPRQTNAALWVEGEGTLSQSHRHDAPYPTLVLGPQSSSQSAGRSILTAGFAHERDIVDGEFVQGRDSHVTRSTLDKSTKKGNDRRMSSNARRTSNPKDSPIRDHYPIHRHHTPRHAHGHTPSNVHHHTPSHANHHTPSNAHHHTPSHAHHHTPSHAHHHTPSRLSSQGSFHLSHLDDSDSSFRSNDDEDLEFYAGEVTAQNHRKKEQSFSKHDGLSWQQYKSRRQEAQHLIHERYFSKDHHEYDTQFDFVGSNLHRCGDERRRSSSRETRGTHLAPHDLSDDADIYPRTSSDFGAPQSLHESGSDDRLNSTELHDYVSGIHPDAMYPENSVDVSAIHDDYLNDQHRTDLADIAYQSRVHVDQTQLQKPTLHPFSNVSYESTNDSATAGKQLMYESPSQAFNKYPDIDFDRHLAAEDDNYNSIDCQLSHKELRSRKDSARADRESLPSLITTATEQVLDSSLTSSHKVLPERTTIRSGHLRNARTSIDDPAIEPEVKTLNKHSRMISDNYFAQHGRNLHARSRMDMEPLVEDNDSYVSGVETLSSGEKKDGRNLPDLSRSQKNDLPVRKGQQLLHSRGALNGVKKEILDGFRSLPKPGQPVIQDATHNPPSGSGRGSNFHSQNVGLQAKSDNELIKSLSGGSDPVLDLLSSSIPPGITKSDSLTRIREGSASSTQRTNKPNDQKEPSEFKSPTCTSKGLLPAPQSKYSTTLSSRTLLKASYSSTASSSQTLLKTSSFTKASSSRSVCKDEEHMQEESSHRVVLSQKTNLAVPNSNSGSVLSDHDFPLEEQTLGSTRQNDHALQKVWSQSSTSSLGASKKVTYESLPKAVKFSLGSSSSTLDEAKHANKSSSYHDSTLHLAYLHLHDRELTHNITYAQKAHRPVRSTDVSRVSVPAAVPHPTRPVSILWTLKLHDLIHSNPCHMHEILVAKAYWFRRWLGYVRLQQMFQREEKDKQRRASTFHAVSLQQKCLRHWFRTVQSRNHRVRLFYQQSLLRKGLAAFRFAVTSSKVQEEQLERRLRNQTLTRCFNKWRLLSQLQTEKECILDQLASQHVTMKAFRVWKEGYQLQQRTGIADLHYKVCLLSKCLVHWQTYIGHQRRKLCLSETARHFHRDRVVKATWVTMATIFKERQKARRQYRRGVLMRAWRAWKHGIEIIKLENLHDNSKAVVFRHRTILQVTFIEWNTRTKLSIVQHTREKLQIRQAFQLWRLKLARRRLIYRILDSKARKALKKRAFLAWRMELRRRREDRERAVGVMRQAHVRFVLKAWSVWTNSQKQLRERLQEYVSCREERATLCVFREWKVQWLRRSAVRRGLKRWSARCLQRAADRWRNHVTQIIRERKADLFLRQSEGNLMKRAFLVWVQGKLEADGDRQRAAEAEHLIARSRLHRTLLAWQLEMMESRAIRPLTDRRTKRHLGRVFDGWRDVVLRKKACMRQLELGKSALLRRAFNHWRNKAEAQQKVMEEEEERDADLVRTCFQTWRRLHERESLGRQMSRHHQEGCLRDAFISWRDQVVEAEMGRAGDEKQKLMLQKMFFRAWRRASGEERAEDDEKSALMDSRQTAATVSRMWERWRKSLDQELKAKAFCERRLHNLLRESFYSWHRFTQKSMAAAVRRFQERLSTSPLSLQNQTPQGSNSSTSPSQGFHSCQTSPDSTPRSPHPSLSSTMSSLSVPTGGILDESGHPSPGNHSVTGPEMEIDPSKHPSRSTPRSPNPSLSPTISSLAAPTHNDGGIVDETRHPSLGNHTSTGPEIEIDASKHHSRDMDQPPQPQRMPLNIIPSQNGTMSHLGSTSEQSVSESEEGSVTSLQQGQLLSVDFHPSPIVMSPPVDSGYSGNEANHVSNGDWQVEASSDSTSVPSVQDISTITDYLQWSPHFNFNNNATQRQYHNSRIDKSQNGDGEFESDSQEGEGEDYAFLRDLTIPGDVHQNGCPFLPLQNGSSHRAEVIDSACHVTMHHVTGHVTAVISREGRVNGKVNDLHSGREGVEGDSNDGDDDNDDDDEDDDNNDDSDDDDDDEFSGETLLRTVSLKESVCHTRQLVASSITDKKAYLRSIIQRLRLWPASAAFYRWLAHTRRQRSLRQHGLVVTSRQDRLRLTAAFTHWTQRYNTHSVADSDVQESSHQNECLGLQQVKDGEDDTAENLELKWAWDVWKQRYLKSQYPIGPIPSWAAHISQSQILLHRYRAFQAKIQTKNERECLRFWALRYQQLRKADQYRCRLVAKRCLLAWWRWSHERRWRQQAAHDMLTRRRKRLAFQRWRSQLSQRDLVLTHYHGAAHTHLRLVLRAWHKWAETSNRLSQSQEVIAQRRDTALLRQAWGVWRQEAEKIRRVQELHDGKTLASTFSMWKTAINSMREQRLSLDSIQSRKRHTALATCFSCWRLEYKARQLALLLRERRARRAKVVCMAAWKGLVADAHSERQTQREFLTQVFSMWRGHHAMTKRRKRIALSAATHWRQQVRKSHDLQQKALACQRSLDERRRQQAFLQWQRSWVKCQVADGHYGNNLLKKALMGWRGILDIAHCHQSMEQQYVVQRQKSLLAQSFRRWRDRQSHMTTLHLTASRVKGHLDSKLLAAAFLTWHQRYLERQAWKSYQQKLVAKVWCIWKTSQTTRQRLRALQRNHESFLLRKCFQALKNWARGRSDRRILLQCVESRKSHFTLKVTFSLWREESLNIQMTRAHYRSHLQKRVLLGWLRVSQRQRRLAAIGLEAEARVSQLQLRGAFYQWQGALAKHRDRQARIERFIRAREGRLVSRCLSDWHHATLVCRGRKLRERRLMRWVVDRWRRKMQTNRLLAQYETELEELAALHSHQALVKKHLRRWRCALESARREKRRRYLELKYGTMWKRLVCQRLMAQAMMRHHRMNRCWMMWRKSLIQEQVSKRMLAQDRRWLVSKTFEAWRQLALDSGR